METKPYSPLVHYLALATACATFPLIFMGGLVTSHGAGMSVPDWPNSYGYNMFLFPPNQWVGGILYEHTHRLMGTVVGMLSIALTIAAVCLEKRTWVKWLAASVLGAVIFQGVLGGLRVVLIKLDLAIVHACIAQAFFCLATLATLVTSRWWLTALDRSDESCACRLKALAVIAWSCIYLQLIVGAVMRHYQAGLAIPDFPLAYGKVLPPTDPAGLETINQLRAWQLDLPRVTLGQVWLHFGHRLGALLVTLAVLALVIEVFRKHRQARSLFAPALLLLGLLITQVTLGIVTVLWRKPADMASAHVAVGALCLMVTFLIGVRAMRLYPRRRPRSTAKETQPQALPSGALPAIR
jgi:cytochrome c oxidase assembly protein subunit 15